MVCFTFGTEDPGVSACCPVCRVAFRSAAGFSPAYWDVRRYRYFIAISRIGVATTTKPRYFEIVSPLEAIVEDLKSLPPARLEAAADFVHRLKRISEEERQAILARTAGALSPEEADELNRVIEEGCEKIDESGW